MEGLFLECFDEIGMCLQAWQGGRHVGERV